ncbi:MAG: hypothetical protein S4CHLAM102_11140 [Chlamydiia bacterium]|nr:hypothetical protein [Chlamydiia bacterium]
MKRLSAKQEKMRKKSIHKGIREAQKKASPRETKGINPHYVAPHIDRPREVRTFRPSELLQPATTINRIAMLKEYINRERHKRDWEEHKHSRRASPGDVPSDRNYTHIQSSPKKITRIQQQAINERNHRSK